MEENDSSVDSGVEEDRLTQLEKRLAHLDRPTTRTNIVTNILIAVALSGLGMTLTASYAYYEKADILRRTQREIEEAYDKMNQQEMLRQAGLSSPIAVSGTGEFIATTDAGTLTVQAGATGDVLWTDDISGPATDVTFVSHGNGIAVSTGGDLRIWRTTDASQIARVSFSKVIRKLSVSADGNDIIALIGFKENAELATINAKAGDIISIRPSPIH